LIFFVSLYILPLGVRNITAPDEIRYAEIPREMISSGDWIVPHFNGLRYFEKPVLGYWVYAGAMLLFGENNFAIRLPSALSVGLSALLIYILIYKVLRKRANEGEEMSSTAVLIFLTYFEVFAVGNTAVLDNLFSFFLTATMIAFYLASEAPEKSRKERNLLILSGISCGLAFLTKGFLAFAVPVLVLAPYLVWQQRYIDLFRMTWLPILIATIVALPWSVMIHLKEPDFWRFFFWHEHIYRFFNSNAQHEAPFWYFFVMIPGIFLPWIFLIPASIIGIKDQLHVKNRESNLLKLSICWLILPFIFFSFSHGKLLTYILPCFPPLAILMTFGLLHVAKSDKQNTFCQWGIFANCILFCILLIVFIWIQLFGFKGIPPYSQPWKIVMLVNSLVFFLLFSYWSFQNQERIQKIFLYGFSPFLLFLCLNFLMPDLALEKKAPGILLLNYNQSVTRDTLIISDNQTAGAACWYFKRNDIYVIGRPGEHHYGLSYNDSKNRKINIKEAVGLIKENPGKVLIVGKAKKINRWKNQFPKAAFEDDSGPKGYAFWEY
jgi:4-amino-4-deoxy-L-arabinose transferase